MAYNETQVTSQLFMDRDSPIGVSTDTFGRRALHTKVTNLPSEPIPVFVTTPSISQAFNRYNEVLGVAASVETTILTYTVLPGNSLGVSGILNSGTNLATYRVYVNGVVIAKKYTWFSGGLNADFNFSGSENTVALSAGDTISITVTHQRPDLGDFNTTLLGLLT